LRATAGENGQSFPLLSLAEQEDYFGRPGTLVAFLVGTYLIAPVGGFGGLLAVLGASHAGSPRRRTPLLVMLTVLEVFGLAF